MENFFGQTRGLGHTYTNPTCLHFAHSFKILLLNNLTTTLNKKGNCEEIRGDLLIAFKSFFQHSAVVPETVLESSISLESILQTPAVQSTTKIQNFPCALIIKKTLKAVRAEGYEPCIKFLKYSYVLDIASMATNILYTQLQSIYDYDFLYASLQTAIYVRADTSNISCQQHAGELLQPLIDGIVATLLHMLCNNVNKVLNGRETVFFRQIPIVKMVYARYCCTKKPRKN